MAKIIEFPKKKAEGEAFYFAGLIVDLINDIGEDDDTFYAASQDPTLNEILVDRAAILCFLLQLTVKEIKSGETSPLLEHLSSALEVSKYVETDQG